MKPEQLRIGNLVSVANAVKVVTGFDTKERKIVAESQDGYTGPGHDAGHLVDYIEVEPLPITEEWLLKLGFTSKTQDQYGNLNFWNKDKDASIDIDLTVSSVHVESLFYYRVHEKIRRKPLRYVHELQNLYYELRREELKITSRSY